MQNNLNIIIMGPPNSGKGTISKYLAEKFNFFHLSTGQILRDNIEQGTELGRKAKPHMLGIVPEQLVSDMVFEKISGLSGFNGVIFDGYPRTIGQAKEMASKLNIDVVILLDVSKEYENKLVERAIDRFICPKCKATLSSKTLKNGLCPYCASKPEKRDDANEKNARHRIDVYNKTTKPVIELFSGKVETIDALKSIEEVNLEAEKIIEKILVKK